MVKDIRFTFVVDEDERQVIERLADKLKRSQSDAVRYCIDMAAKVLLDTNGKEANDELVTDA